LADNFGTIKIIGVEDLIKDLEKYDDRIQTEIAHEIRASAENWERKAKRNATRNRGVDQGRILQLISQRPAGKMTRELISGAEHTAFQEFGTKSRFRVDRPELLAFAQQFKGIKLSVGPKGGMGFRQAIYEWAKRKGIPKNAWWSIYQSIRAFGRHPKPFFFPAYFEEIALLRKRIENILNKTQL
jgi:hypothetical protein